MISGAILFVLFVVSANSFCSAQIQWAPNMDAAQRAANAQNKLVLLHFEADWCRPCKALETYVFSEPSVQRAFAKNVVPVRINSETELGLVQKYGVQSLPFDVVLTPAGKVVTKRTSPNSATQYENMVASLSRAIATMNKGGAGTDQSLQDLAQVLGQPAQNRVAQNAQNIKTASITPGFPQPRVQGPSTASAELKRQGQVVQNPFVQAGQSSGGAAFQSPNQAVQPNQMQAALTMSAPAKLPPPMQLPRSLTIKNKSALIVPGQVVAPEPLTLGQQSSNDFVRPDNNQFVGNAQQIAPPRPPSPQLEAPGSQQWNSNPVSSQSGGDFGSGTTQLVPPAVAKNQMQLAPNQFMHSAQTPALEEVELNGNQLVSPPVPQQQGPPKPKFEPIHQSDVAAKLIREQAEQKIAGFRPEPRRIMDDKFYGNRSAKQNGNVVGNYQAKINIPKSNNDFVPEPPQMGSASAQIVSRATNHPALGFSPRQNSVLARPVSSPSNIIRHPKNNIEEGLAAAASKPAPSKFALHGKCPVTLLTETKWVDGDKEIGCVHRNRIYIFASQEKLELFQSDPDAFSPILAGYDPVVFAESGRLKEGLEEFGVFMGKSPRQRIVLFETAESRAKFQLAPRRYLENVRQAMVNSGGASSKLTR